MIITQAASCRKLLEGKNDALTLPRRSYDGKELHMDGFYYTENSDGRLFHVRFLYKNGVMFELGSGFYTIKDIKNTLITANFKETKKTKWGIFNIDSNNIKIEQWGEPLGIGSGMRIKIDHGIILNDTTYVVYKMTTSDGRENVRQDTFHFYPYTPKPDSINL